MSDSMDTSKVPISPKVEELDIYDGDISQDTEDSKILFKTALVYCEKLLLENNHISLEPSTVIEQVHSEIGEKMYRSILETIIHYKSLMEDELIMSEEVPEEGTWVEAKEPVSRSHDDDDDYEPQVDKITKSSQEFIPLEYKIKVVNMARSHPKWSLKSLHRKGASRLKRMDQLKVWEEHIKSGGTTVDKYTAIDTETYDRFVKARLSKQHVTTRNLQQWALAAASKFPDLTFRASRTWVERFKVKKKIRQRQTTRFTSE